MERVELRYTGEHRWYSIAYCANYLVDGFGIMDQLAAKHPSPPPLCAPIRLIVNANDQRAADQRIKANIPDCIHGARKVLDNSPQFDN